MKAFPPGQRGILLPLDDAKAAALGICLFTGSKPWVVALQRAAHLLVGAGGLRTLPYGTEFWQPPCSADEWRSLVTVWHDVLGPFDRLAFYRRRQQARSGHTLLLTHRGTATALVKFRRNAGGGLEVEQDALEAVSRFGTRTFRAPLPLGTGLVGQLRWSAQESVFTRPHSPVFQPPPELFHELAECLALMAPSPAGSDISSSDSTDALATDLETAHGDLTPWNLRRDRAGQVWLYDWEDVGSAPADSDRAYFWATTSSLGKADMPADLSARAVEHCRAVVVERNKDNPEDAPLLAWMLRALDEADKARRAAVTSHGHPPG